MARSFLTAAAIGLFATSAAAQTPALEKAGETKAGAATGAKPAPLRAKSGKVGKKTLVARWPGFRMIDGGRSEVFVDLSAPIAQPKEHRAAGTVTYVIPGAKLAATNDGNPLLTHFFDTPVARARLVAKKGELHLVIDLRAGSDGTPSAGLRPSPDSEGGQQLFVTFPPAPGSASKDPVPEPTTSLKASGSPGSPSADPPKAEPSAPNPGVTPKATGAGPKP
jgi:hypothetical protein